LDIHVGGVLILASFKCLGLGAGLLLAVSFVHAASAQTPSPPSLHAFAEVSLSPSGALIASVETDQPLAPTTKRPRGPVVVRDRLTGAVVATYDPCPACRYAGLTWSPDGAALAFIATDAETGQAALDVVRGGQAKVLASLAGVAQTPRFSPDGTLIALMATPGAHKETGAVEAGAQLVGDIDALTVADEKRIAVLPAAGGALRYVSPADTFIYEYDWRPDGQGFVATAAKGNGDDNWWIAKLIAVDLDGSPARVIAAPDVQMNAPRVSPDGRSVVFIGGLMSDFGSVGGDIYAAPFSGGVAKDITPGLKATFTSLTGWRDGRLLATLLRGEQEEIVSVDTVRGALETRWAAPVSTRAADGRVSFSADGALAAAESQDFTHAPEILAGAPGPAFRPVTESNAALAPQTRAMSVAWKNEGFDVQGWLLAPLAPTPGRHPLVVEIHGGPSAAVTPHYVAAYDDGLFPIAEWLRRGYYVFYANPRGSYGQGEAFTRANVRDFGGGDLRDILAGVDKVETLAPVDDKRLGVFGHSYGGYMTMWTVTHSHRFAAAISGAGIANWISYYGENGIDKWMIPFFGASAYDDPAIYEKASPILAIKNARTPTLIYVGERDVECPAPQSFEFWHGLKAEDVPTSLIVYQGQGHAIRDPADLKDLRARQLAWFATYLGS
jgi:dipeptidyl aminopeptidase/acylaminoacyl peptidase